MGTTLKPTTTITSESTTETQPTPDPDSPESSYCDDCQQGCKSENGKPTCFCYEGYKTGCNEFVCDRDESIALPDFTSRSCPTTNYRQRIGRRYRNHKITWKKLEITATPMNLQMLDSII